MCEWLVNNVFWHVLCNATVQARKIVCTLTVTPRMWSDCGVDRLKVMVMHEFCIGLKAHACFKSTASVEGVFQVVSDSTRTSFCYLSIHRLEFKVLFKYN